MALSQSSQFRGPAGVSSSLGSPRQRHRSASRHITNCHRADLSVKANVHERNLGDSSLQEGDQVQIFSHSGGMWADGRIMSILEEGHVWVEYKVGNVWCGKVLHILSEYLTAHSTVVQEYDPQAWWLPCLGSRQKQLRAGEGLLGMEVEPSQSVDNYADMENPCTRWKPTEKRLVGVETLTKVYTMGYGEAAIKLTKNIDVDEDFGNKVVFTVKSIDGRELTDGVSLGAGVDVDFSSLTVGLEAKIARELTDGEGALSFEFSVPLLRIALKDHDPPADSSPYVSQAILGCTAKGEISAYGSCHAQGGVGIKAAANDELLLQAKVSADFKQKSGKNGYNVKVEALGGPPIKMPRQDKTMQEVFTYLQDGWLRKARHMPELWKVLKVQIRNCKHSESPDPALGEECVSHMQALHQKVKHPEKCSPDDSVKSLIKLIHLGRIEAKHVASRHLTMVIGSTGSGKSTLINYLLGCPMELVKVKGRCVVQVKQGSTVGRIAEIGHGKTSSTFRPSVYPIGALDLCDCAGYGDTRGMEIRIGNAVMLRQLAHHAKGVNFVILFNYNSLDVDRAGGLRQLIQTLISYFGSASGLKQYADAVMLGITRVQQKHETVEDIRQVLCDPEGLDQGEVEVLEKVSKNIFVYDPLDNGNESWCNRAQLLQNIREMRVIDREHGACMFETALGAQEEQWLCSLKEGFAQRIDLNMKTGDYATAAREMQHILILVENLNSATVVRRFADLRASVISHIQEQIDVLTDVLTQAGYSGAQAFCEVKSRLESMRKDIIHFQYDAELHDAIDRHWQRGMEYVQKWNDKEALGKQLQALDLRSVAHTKSDEPEAPKVPEIAESTIISPSTDASHADQNQAGRAEHRWSNARDVMSKGLPSMASMRDQSEQCLPLSFSAASAQAMASTHNTLYVPKVEKEFLRAKGQAAGQKNEQSEQARNHQQVQELIDAEYIGVEYKRGNYGCSKKLHVDSEHVHLTTQSADEMPLEKCHSADPHCDGKGSETQQKNEEPTFRCGDEVHYYRDGPNVWVFATITKVLKESAEVSYELQYEAWDGAPACMKKHKVSEKKLLDMQGTCYQQLSQGSTSGVEASRNRSLRIDGKPMWCRTSAKDGIRQVQKGDEVWFKHSNRNAVVAEIKDLHEWEGDDAKADLTYVGLDEQDVPRRWHKEGVTKGELAILQHPRNWQSSPKRAWCEDKQQAAALASKRKTTQLHAASRDGDVELVRCLLLQRVNPMAQDTKTGSSALHAAAYHGHPIVLDMLVNQVEHTVELSEHKNWFGETPLDVARERLRFYPRDDAVEVFVCLFGRNPRAQEKASRVMESITNSRDIRTYNQGFLEAVMLCPLIGDRTAPYNISTCDVHEIAMGIEKEERRVLDDECQEYNDWSYWRASFARGIRRHGIEDAFTRRMDAAKMRQLLHNARNDSSNAEFALPRCAIQLYTAATFLFKATNFAMRSKDHAFKFEHLGPYARLLNYSVRYFADKQPWKDEVHRVLPIYDDETVRKYSQRAKAVYDHERFFSWSGFISATAWVQECKIFQDLRKYGAGKECIVFIISPDPQGGSVYPVDLGDMGFFGAEDREILYPAGQQFKVMSYEGRHTREQFAQNFSLKFDIAKDKGENLHVVRLMAVEAFTEFSHDFFKEGGNIKAAEKLLMNRLQEVRRQGDTLKVLLHQSHLARCWHAMGKYEEAEPMFRQILKVQEQELGLTHPNTLTSSSNLAALLMDMGKYEEAEPMFRQILKVQEQDLGLTHPNTLASCSNLAELLRAMGKYEEAEPMFRQILKVQEQQLGLTHPHTLTSFNNLAALLMNMGKYEEAEPMFRQNLKVQEQDLGLTHPDTLRSCNNLALLLKETGKYEEAEPMFGQNLKVQEQQLGLTHPDTLRSCNNLALLLKEMGKYEEAEPMFRQRLKVQEQQLGLTHPHTLTSCKNLALLLKETGKYEEAERMLRQTLEAADARLGPNHKLTRECRRTLAIVLGKTSIC